MALEPRETAVTLGVFDGVHRGHQRIIESLLRCKTAGLVGSCFLITFDPHPVVVTHSRITPPILTTIEERIDLFRAYPLDGVFVIRFDATVADTDYRSFLDKYLLKALDMKMLVLGYDFHFGRNREGTPERVRGEAKKKGFKIKIIPPVQWEGSTVSSSVIRNTLLEGNLARANDLLGHPYTVSGEVIHGHGLGRSIGFPTANLAVHNPYKLWPPLGVYAVTARLDGNNRYGMMNIGRAPTLKTLQEGAREIEIHIFDFEEDLYGCNLTVDCRAYLREERPFPSVEALRVQLDEDERAARNILSLSPAGRQKAPPS
jgi:riboflavin kinase/FMN adenylyltransferase